MHPARRPRRAIRQPRETALRCGRSRGELLGRTWADLNTRGPRHPPPLPHAPVGGGTVLSCTETLASERRIARIAERCRCSMHVVSVPPRPCCQVLARAVFTFDSLANMSTSPVGARLPVCDLRHF